MILANSPVLSGTRIVTRTPDTDPPSRLVNWSSRSVSVMTPTTMPCSRTGKQPILFLTMRLAASSSVAFRSIVRTSLALIITSLTVRPDR